MTSAQHRPDRRLRDAHKAFWRILPLIALAYLCAYTDRVNIGFAAAKMNADLGFSATVYGLGAGLFFLGYALFEIPSNLLCARFRPRKWIADHDHLGPALGRHDVRRHADAVLRGALPAGRAEAGFYPGVIYYFSGWFPATSRAASAAFRGWPRHLDRPAGRGLWSGCWTCTAWRDSRAGSGCSWCRAPSVLVGLLVLFLLPDRPDDRLALRADEGLDPPNSSANSCASAAGASTARWPRCCNPARACWSADRLHADRHHLDRGAVRTAGARRRHRACAARGRLGHQLGGAIGVVVIIWSGNVADRANARFQDSLVYSMLMARALLVLASSTTAAVTLAAYHGIRGLLHGPEPEFTRPAGHVLPNERELAVGSAAINTLAQTGAFVMPFAWGALRDATGDYRAGL